MRAFRTCAIIICFVAGAACSDTATSGDAWFVDESDVERPTAPTAPATAEPTDPTEPPTTHEQPDAIVGVWLIDQPYHALYEATLYDFRPDGELVELSSQTYGHEVPTGTVGRCEQWSPQNDDHCADFDNTGQCTDYYPAYCTGWADVSCTFGTAWWSPADGALAIDTVCTDNRNRTAIFDISAVLEGTAEAPRVVSVDGEDGWEHNMWDWRWLKCTDDVETCPNFGP